MRRVSLFLSGLFLVLAVAACGSNSSSPSSEPASPTPRTSAETVAQTPDTTSALPTASSSTATTASATSSVGPARAGSVIRSGSSSKLPATVDGFTKQPASGPAAIYENSNGDQLSVTFLSGSKYETIVTALTQSKTPAGTGTCGTDTDPSNATCYLKAADGVYNISGDAVRTVASFSNELTAGLGTS
jgi:hypothetical protein